MQLKQLKYRARSGDKRAITLLQLAVYAHELKLHYIINFARKLFKNSHTKIYDKQDLIMLLQKQRLQDDNRIHIHQLDIALNSLKFGDDAVSQHFTPSRQIRMVEISESVGPVLMGELHASGHASFPVYDGKKSNIIGILQLDDLVNAKQVTNVQKLMVAGITTVCEDQTIHEALQIILKNPTGLLIVRDNLGNYLGIITPTQIFTLIVGNN